MDTIRRLGPGPRTLALATAAHMALTHYGSAQAPAPAASLVGPARPVWTQANAPLSDPAVKLASLNDGSPASAQTEETPPSAPPKLQPQPQPAPPSPVAPAVPPPPPLAAPPTYQPYAPPPTAPPVAAYYYVPQAPPMAPAAPSNLFLPPTAPPAGYAPPPAAYTPPPAAYAQPPAYAPPPTYAQPMAYAPVAAQPMAYAPVAAQPVMGYAPVAAQPVAPAAGLVNMANQSVSVPTSRSTTTFRVRGPSLLDSSLARLGERLVQRGRTRIETVHETVLDSPSIQQPTGGLATITTATASPVAPPAAPVAPPLTPTVPEGPTASPQGGAQTPQQKHSLLHHLLGHD